MYESSRARLFGALLVVGALTLSGCTDDPAKPKPLPSPTSSSPAASPSQTAPTMPPAAKGTSAASAEAFARHYVDLINYAMHSGDTAPMLKSRSKPCAPLASLSAEALRTWSQRRAIAGTGWRCWRVLSESPGNECHSAAQVVQSSACQLYRKQKWQTADAIPSEGRSLKSTRDDVYVGTLDGQRIDERLDDDSGARAHWPLVADAWHSLLAPSAAAAWPARASTGSAGGPDCNRLWVKCD